MGNHIDPSEIVFKTVQDFALRHKGVLTDKEYMYLTERKYKMAYFYSLPKLHKCAFINEFLQNTGTSYIHIPDLNNKIDGRPIVGGPCYHTSGLSEMVDILLKPVVKYIPYLLKDSFDLLEKVNTDATNDILLGSCDIKSLYTNISHDLAYKAIDYWLTLTWDILFCESRFSKQFILEALRIILECNYFYFDSTFWHQVLGFAMGTKAAVQCANLIVAYLEEKMFKLLPSIYPQDYVYFIIQNYFRFLDDIFFKWLRGFNIATFYEIFEGLDPQLKFIFSELSRGVDFLDISFSIADGILHTDVYHKPTDSHNYLDYSSCHPSHTKNNIAASLARRIIRIANVNRDSKLDELKRYLERKGHPSSVINCAYSKVFSPHKPPEGDNSIVFICTHNPTHVFNTKTIRQCLDKLHGDELKKAFDKHRVMLSSRQPPSLRTILVSSKFDRVPHFIQQKTDNFGLFSCTTCIYCTSGIINSCTRFSFGPNGKFKWEYKRRFTCNSLNVIYVLKCNYCWQFYIGQTTDFKQRTSKHKSDVFHPENSNCKKCMEHIRTCSRLVSPFFTIYPILYENDTAKRRFLEKRQILKYKPRLNGDS